jgi:hypothetical protein
MTDLIHHRCPIRFGASDKLGVESLDFLKLALCELAGFLGQGVLQLQIEQMAPVWRQRFHEIEGRRRINQITLSG